MMLWLLKLMKHRVIWSLLLYWRHSTWLGKWEFQFSEELDSKIYNCECCSVKKVKVAHTRLPSVGFRSWSRNLAVSLQVTWVINPAIGCRYFPPGLQLPLWGLPAILLLGERGTMGVNSLPKTSDSIAAAIWTQALLRLTQHTNQSATEPSQDRRP